MKNKFLQNATKQTHTSALDFILSQPSTPLEIIRKYESGIGTYSAREYALAKARYKSQLRSFAKKNIDNTSFEQFQKRVNSYRKVAKLPAHPFDDFTSFKDIMTKTNQNVWLDKKLFKNEKTILKSKSENDIRMAYVQYWMHKMTYVHNKNIINRAKNLYEKHNPNKEFVVTWSDVYGMQRVESNGQVDVKMAPVDLSALDKLIDITPNLMLRADESIYTDVRVLKKPLQQIFQDYDDRTLKHYRNLNTLYLANIIHSMMAAGWSQSTLDMIMEYLRDGGSSTSITDIVDDLMDDGYFDSTWKYKEKIDENGVKQDESLFLQRFRDMVASELPDDSEPNQNDSKLGYEPGLKFIRQ